jgi:hypothetical protein
MGPGTKQSTQQVFHEISRHFNDMSFTIISENFVFDALLMTNTTLDLLA